MLGIEVGSSTDAALSHDRNQNRTWRFAGFRAPAHRSHSKATASTSRAAADSIVIRAGTERGLIHASSSILEKLGAQFPPGVAPSYPRIEPAPPRRAQTVARDARVQAPRVHLRHHDLELQPSRSPRVASSPRPRIHPVDGAARESTRSRTFATRTTRASRSTKSRRFCASMGSASNTAATSCKSCCRAIASAEHPEYFPAADDGVRAARGNLCVSNPDAVALVRQGALAYVHDHPENELLHIWGADVRRGAWCRCGQCRELPPQIQYMEVVNAIAGCTRHRSKGAADRVPRVSRHDRSASRPEAARQRVVRMGAARAMLQPCDR